MPINALNKKPFSLRSGCTVRILLSSVRFASSSFPNNRRFLLHVAFLTEIEGGGGDDWATGRRQISYCFLDGAAASRENSVSRSRGWVTGRAIRSIRVLCRSRICFVWYCLLPMRFGGGIDLVRKTSIDIFCCGKP